MSKHYSYESYNLVDPLIPNSTYNNEKLCDYFDVDDSNFDKRTRIKNVSVMVPYILREKTIPERYKDFGIELPAIEIELNTSQKWRSRITKEKFLRTLDICGIQSFKSISWGYLDSNCNRIQWKQIENPFW